MSESEYFKVGDRILGDHPAVFELVLEEHVPFVDPNTFGIPNQSGINPRQYFVTSGDAVEKAKVLDRDLWKYAGDMRKLAYELIAEQNKVELQEAQKMYRDGIRPTEPVQFADYEKALWSAAGKARSLLNALIRAKGDNCFLETEWEQHRLLCIPKNPRR